MYFGAIILAVSFIAQFVGVFERSADPSLATVLGDEHDSHKLIVAEAYGRLFATEVFGNYRSCYVAVLGGLPKYVYFVEGPPTLYSGNPTGLEIRQSGNDFHEIDVRYRQGGLFETLYYDQRVGNTMAFSVAFLKWRRLGTKPDLKDMFEVRSDGKKHTCLPSSELTPPDTPPYQ